MGVVEFLRRAVLLRCNGEQRSVPQVPQRLDRGVPWEIEMELRSVRGCRFAHWPVLRRSLRHFPQAHRVVGAAGHEPPAILGQGEAEDRTTVALELFDLLSG